MAESDPPEPGPVEREPSATEQQEADPPSDVPEALQHALDSLVPDEVEASSFAPTSSRRSSMHRRWWGRHLSEVRFQAEAMRLSVDPVFYGLGVPHGDGRPVVLVPGFLAADASLTAMGSWLWRIGYHAHGSGIRLANVDCSDRALDRIERRVEKLAERSGRKVSLIGHSRGGLYVKALCTRRPDLVHNAVSMGAALDQPYDISVPTKAMVAATRRVLVATSSKARENGCLTRRCTCPFTRDFSAPFGSNGSTVPLTSIYSRGDGVVWWPSCIVPYATNVEVTGSHVGLAFNRKAYRAVAHALAAPVTS